MTLSSENRMKLMAYADGELDGASLTEAQMLLASDAEAVRFVEQIAGLGELVQRGHEARLAKSIASFDVADAVMDLAKEADNEDIRQVRQVRGSSVRDLGEMRAARLKVGAGIAAALALAASIFVFAQHRTEEVPMAIAPTPAAEPATSGAAGTGVAVESAGKSVSVFYLPTANELSTSVVVWVDETGEK